jgi:hypothetical protein
LIPDSMMITWSSDLVVAPDRRTGALPRPEFGGEYDQQ